jgi:hypothetical protein
MLRFIRTGLTELRGGLAAYVRDGIRSFVYQPHTSLMQKDVEIMWLELSSSRFYIALCYLPPRPVYSVDASVSQLMEGMDCIHTSQNDCIILVAGDVNTL